MTAYQYKIVSGVAEMTKGGKSIDWSDFETRLNELVVDGWELVSANTTPYGLLVFGCGSQEPLSTCVLRKAKTT